VAADVATPEAVVAREAAGRGRAAVAAAVSGLLSLGGSIGFAIALHDRPHVLVVDALRDAAGEPVRDGGLRSAQVLFYDDHSTALVGIAIALGLGALALIVPLLYLYRAARARRPQTPNVALVMAVAGPIALAVAQLLLQGGLAVRAHDFVTSGDHGSQAAHDVFSHGAVLVGQLLWQASVIAIGFAFVVICLNAMRAGLLTRFMGILGIIVGVLFVIPIGSPLPIVQTFWLLAAAVLIAGRWPNGVPPAWHAGVAVPWPSQQDLREARERAAPPAPQDEEPAAPRREKQSSRAQAASKKKRRRR
jgi:hypothetical protein